MQQCQLTNCCVTAGLRGRHVGLGLVSNVARISILHRNDLHVQDGCSTVQVEWLTFTLYRSYTVLSYVMYVQSDVPLCPS